MNQTQRKYAIDKLTEICNKKIANIEDINLRIKREIIKRGYVNSTNSRGVILLSLISSIISHVICIGVSSL